MTPELAALLRDEQRLNAEYPKVAEYLDCTLPGGGDDGFDLRLVNLLTGGESASGNPYWDIVAGSVVFDRGRRVVKGGARLAFAETILQSAYAYAIPSPETLAWLAAFCAGRPVVELGAGRGYWLAQLARIGVEVAGFDLEPPDVVTNVSFPPAPGQPDVWHPVSGLEHYAAQSDRVLFLCWPPGWGNTMASRALADFEAAGGDRLVFIGEPNGGKTGDDAFFERLSAAWQLETQDTQFVSWWNLNDVAQGWVRR